MKIEVEGEEEATQEIVADGTLEEGHDGGLEIGVLGLSEPVLESGPWDAGLLAELALRGGGSVRMVKVVARLGGLCSASAAGVWTGVRVRVKLRRSHGP